MRVRCCVSDASASPWRYVIAGASDCLLCGSVLSADCSGSSTTIYLPAFDLCLTLSWCAAPTEDESGR